MPESTRPQALLRRLARQVRTELDERLRAAGVVDVGAAHVQILGFIGDSGMRPTDVAASLGVTKQAVGKLVDQLAASGYAERRPDPADARARLVTRTVAGDRLVHEASGVLDEIEARWRARLGAQRFAEFGRDLAALVETE